MSALIPYTNLSVVTQAQIAQRDPLFAPKSADQLLNTNTTFINDSALFVAVAANATYRWELSVGIRADNATNGGMKVQWTFPTGASMPNTIARWGGNTSPGGFRGNGADAGITLTTSNVMYEQQGTLVIGANAGTFQFQWAQNSSSAANSIVASGSFLLVRQVA